MIKRCISRSLRRWIVSRVFSFIPLTRFYSLKRLLLNFADVVTSGNVRVISSARFYGTGAIIIGKDSFIGHEVLIIAAQEPVIIGKYVDIAPRVCIVNGSHSIGNERRAGVGCAKKIVIDEGTWIGAGSVVIAGVHIGRQAVIGAGSIVIHDIEPNVLAIGNPCKKIKILI